MKNKSQITFYGIAASVCLVIAIYYICDGGIFIGCFWAVLSILHFIQLVIQLKKVHSEKSKKNQ